MPVSRTSNRTLTCASSCRTTLPISITLPCSVNFTAFVTKFNSICPRRAPSPCNTGGTSLILAITSSPLSSAFSLVNANTLLITCSNSKSVGSKLIFPASIFEKSKISLMIDNRCIAAPETLSNWCFCCSLLVSRLIK